MQRITADLLQTETQVKVLGQPAAPMHRVSNPVVDPEANRARDEQVALLKQARELAYAEGMKAAEREIQKRVQEIEADLAKSQQKSLAELETTTAALKKAAASIETAINQHAIEAEEIAIEIAYASILRLLGDKAVERILMQEICHAVSNEYGHSIATLRISEADSSMLESAALNMPIQIDHRLKPGECVVETARGQFACGIDVRLEALKKAFILGFSQHRGQV
jgi:flagellar assembly protein FliH